MLGKGLESLIPNKNNGGQGANPSDDYAYDEEVAEAPVRPEREGLGVLGSFSRPAAQQPQQPAPQQRQEPAPQEFPHAAAPQPSAFNGPVQPQPVRPEPQESEIVPASYVPKEAPQEEPARENYEIPMLSGPIFHIEIDKIVINPYQPRKEFDQQALKELSLSIREFGILQPLVVTKQEEETDFGTKVTYQLIAGHRRLLASKMAGLKTVPVVIRNALKKTEALEMAIVENIQRRDLNIIETARAYARLSDEFSLTQREIASRLGKSREAVANALRLLALPSEIQDAISAGKISESQARLLLQIQSPQRQHELFMQILTENLSVRDLKKRITQVGAKRPAPGSPAQPMKAHDVELKSMEKSLSDFLGAPVHVEYTHAGGKIIIHFYSPEEASGIVQKIKKEDY
jgi:ParB family chromosome partitioning protein